jgi:epoxyqueuosine reductase
MRYPSSAAGTDESGHLKGHEGKLQVAHRPPATPETPTADGTGQELEDKQTHPSPEIPQRPSHRIHLPAMRGTSGAARGRISCYAGGDDYHNVLDNALVKLETFAQEQGASQTKSYVDTGPVLERDWAARAGLGWIGKNTMLINQGLGSWLFLGTVLTNVELAPDDPSPDRCGTCTECLDACPTGALVSPYLLDSRLCISYLTIEHKGAIPPRLRPLVGDWVFGCDICQSVCPWNRRIPDAENPAFAPHDGLCPLDLEWALSNPDALSQLIAGTPVERAKGHRLIRNIIVAAGNSGSLRVARALEPYAVNPPPELAEHVSWALKQLRG